jgi:voltage-gated potassium channel Kch
MAGERPTSIRDRYNSFIEGHEFAWELSMSGVALLWIGLAFADRGPVLDAMFPLLTLTLWVEFATRLAASRHRRKYLLDDWHWLDAVALIPLTELRWLRLVRLVRVFGGVYRAFSAIEQLKSSRRLVWLFFAWAAVAVICSAILYVYESGVNDAVGDTWDAAYWGVVTLTTVGYGDVTPVTPEGRIAAATLMVLGITLFAAITGTITSRFVLAEEADSGADQNAADRLRRAAALHADGLLTDDEYQAKRAELLEVLEG